MAEEAGRQPAYRVTISLDGRPPAGLAGGFLDWPVYAGLSTPSWSSSRTPARRTAEDHAFVKAVDPLVISRAISPASTLVSDTSEASPGGSRIGIERPSQRRLSEPGPQ